MLLLGFALSVLLLQDVQGATNCTHWGYLPENGPLTWPEHDPTCNGSYQSPVDIDPTKTIQDNYSAFNLSDAWYETDHTWVLANNGHSVQVTLDRKVNNVYSQSGGGFPDGDYRDDQFHFHWGSKNTQGSEHTQSGLSYVMEMHIVNYDNTYGSFANASTQVNGLGVLGFWWEIGAENPYLNTIVNHLINVTEPETSINITGFALYDMIQPAFENGDYYRYNGSLTTPSCLESKIWTIFVTPLQMSQAQLDAFRSRVFMPTCDPAVDTEMVDNWRFTQPLNGRDIAISSNMNVP